MTYFRKSLEGQTMPESLDSYTLSKRMYSFVYNAMSNIASEELYSNPSWDTSTYHKARADIASVLDVYFPNYDDKYQDAIVMWPTPESRNKGRSARQPMRIGRALRRMFPALPETVIDGLVDKVRREFFSNEFTYHVGKDAASFKHAYSHTQANFSNVETSGSKKHLANSCMRYSFNSLSNHPTEAYASGDFEIHWLEDPQGNIAARCVVAVAMEGVEITPQRAPIYCVSEPAYNQLVSKLDSLGCVNPVNASWVGSRLLAIRAYGEDDNSFIAPYLDLTPRSLNVQPNGKFLEITRRGSIDASDYGGILSDGSTFLCCECGEHTSENDVCNHNDNHYCPDCFHNLFSYCEYCEEYEWSDDSSIVLVSGWGSRGNEQSWCQHCVQNHAVETIDGELWYEDDVVLRADGEHISRPDYDNHYFECILDGEVYHIDEAQTLESGNLARLDNILGYNKQDYRDWYVLNADSSEWQRLSREQGLERTAL